MALFDNIFNNSQDPAQQQAALDLQGQVNNSVIPASVTDQFNAPVTASDVQASQPMQVIPDSTATMPQQDASTGSDTSVLGKLANLFTDPAFLQSAAAFGASMSGDVDSYNQNMNAYARTMENRRAEQVDRYNQQLARQQQVADRADERAWQEKQAYRDSLYKQYTADSVNSFLQSGDQSVLKQQELTPWQQAQIGVRQQQADAATTRANRGNVDQALANLNALDGDGTERTPIKDSTGTWQVPNYNSKGMFTGYKVAGPAQQKQLSENEKSKLPSANETQMNKDLQTLSTAVDKGNVGSFTGNVVGRSDFLQDVGSSVFGNDEARTAQRSAERINGMMLSQGVADAKSMGASGINTAAEAQMYFRGMPRLDYTSPDALKRSIQDIQTYTSQFNSRNRGVAAPTQSTPTTAPSSAPSTPSTGSTGGITMRRIG